MSGRLTFVLEIFEISRKSCDFRIFFRFPYEVANSANFWLTCRKCMSGDSSHFPVWESIKFEKQMRIFKAIFEKKKIALHVKRIYRDFRTWHCELWHFVLRSFTWLQKKEFSKNSHLLPRYEIFPKLIHSFIQTLQVLKNCMANGLIFADFFVFLNFLQRFLFDLSRIFTRCKASRADFPENFGKIRQKSGLLGGFSRFSTSAPHIIEIGRRNSQRTIYAMLPVYRKKEFWKNSQ